MKTKNNVQKTILRFAAVVISFILISFTVSAQDFWKRLIAGSSFNEIALAMVDHSKKVSNNSNSESTLFDFIMNQEKDSPMSIESWMVDEDFFGVANPAITIETEASLKVESWMLNDNLFEEKEAEESLKLEKWMVSDDLWMR